MATLLRAKAEPRRRSILQRGDIANLSTSLRLPDSPLLLSLRSRYPSCWIRPRANTTAEKWVSQLFGRVAQQVLAYMNVPHDADVKNSQRLMIRASAKESDFSEGSPDRLSGEVDEAEIVSAETAATPATTVAAGKKEADRARVIAASFTPAKETRAVAQPAKQMETPAVAAMPTPTRGTVILDAGNGPVAPALIGKSVRSAIETAQNAGVEIDVVGSGVARAQAPAAGEHVPPGTRVVVKFAR